MRQYRPTIEQLKKRYSADMARRKRMEKIIAQRPAGAKRVQIPDNSEPWLPHPPESIEQCAWISNKVRENIESWRRAFPITFSSAG